MLRSERRTTPRASIIMLVMIAGMTLTPANDFTDCLDGCFDAYIRNLRRCEQLAAPLQTPCAQGALENHRTCTDRCRADAIRKPASPGDGRERDSFASGRSGLRLLAGWVHRFAAPEDDLPNGYTYTISNPVAGDYLLTTLNGTGVPGTGLEHLRIVVDGRVVLDDARFGAVTLDERSVFVPEGQVTIRIESDAPAARFVTTWLSAFPIARNPEMPD